MTTYLINYADKTHYQAQKINTYTGLGIGGLNQAIQYSVADIDYEFATKNAHILQQSRGAGYWLWKPYFILKTLHSIKDGDVVFYSDAGVEFIKSTEPLVNLCLHETKGVLVFHMEPTSENKEVLQTKKDAFVLLDCNTPEYQNSWARLASFSVWRKNDFSLQIASEWLEYAQDERIITDLPNQCGIPEDPRFIDHRHDQSILSLLTKKHNIPAYPDPSQWGDGYRDGRYEQVINHTRNRA